MPIETAMRMCSLRIPVCVGLLQLMLLVTPATSAIGQQRDRVPPGTRVRLMARGLTARPLVGVVTEWRSDSLVFQPIERSLLHVPLGSLTRFEVSRGRHSHWVLGGAIGLATGVAASGFFLWLFCEDPDTSCHADTVGRVFAIIGLPPTILGTAVGFAIRTERWERLPLTGLRAADIRDGRGIAAGVHIAF